MSDFLERSKATNKGEEIATGVCAQCQMPANSSDNVEFLLCQTSHSATGVVQIVLVYKSPACTLSHFKDTILKYLLPQVNLRKSVLIFGDFNFDMASGHPEF